MQLAGVLAPSPMSQWSIVLLSLPFDPVVVLKTTVPLVALVFTPLSMMYRTVSLLASLMKRSATPEVLVFAMVSCDAVPPPLPTLLPTPPGRPSMVTNRAPFRSTVAVVVSGLVMKSAVAPLAGRMVRVFAALAPLSDGMVRGKVSTVPA